MGLEPTTFCLASRRSTAELRPLSLVLSNKTSRVKLPERKKSVKVLNVSLIMLNERRYPCIRELHLILAQKIQNGEGLWLYYFTKSVALLSLSAPARYRQSSRHLCRREP